MTDLEKSVDMEVGNDTEKSRLNFLKYVEYGKQLATEAMAATQPIYTQSQLDQAVEAKAQEIAAAVLNEVQAVLNVSGDKQVKAEKAEIDGIKAIQGDQATLDQVKALVQTAHKAAVDITVNDRDPGLAAIKAKYVKA